MKEAEDQVHRPLPLYKISFYFSVLKMHLVHLNPKVWFSLRHYQVVFGLPP